MNELIVTVVCSNRDAVKKMGWVRKGRSGISDVGHYLCHSAATQAITGNQVWVDLVDWWLAIKVKGIGKDAFADAYNPVFNLFLVVQPAFWFGLVRYVRWTWNTKIRIFRCSFMEDECIFLWYQGRCSDFLSYLVFRFSVFGMLNADDRSYQQFSCWCFYTGTLQSLS